MTMRGRPIGRKSKTPNGAKPASRNEPLTTILEVVNKVAMPPKIVPYASGGINLDGLTPEDRVSVMTAGNMIPTTAILFIIRDNPAAVRHVTRVKAGIFFLPTRRIQRLRM